MKLWDAHTHSREQVDSELRWTNFMPNRETAPVNQPFTAGFHPYYLDNLNWEELEIALQDPNCQALGECGLDKTCATPWDLQLQVLQRQLELAQKYQLPLLFHCVRSFAELQTICNATLPKGYPKIIHGFSKKAPLALALIKDDFSLSFGKLILDSPTLQHAWQAASLTHVLLETDGHTVDLGEIYEKAAALKSLSVSALIEQMHENRIKLQR